jgi:cytochrome c peroxidase
MKVQFFKCVSLTILIVSTFACKESAKQVLQTKAELGEALFNDISLSRDGTQSCASCHDQSHAFIDSRVNETNLDLSIASSVSTGQDAIALGDINTPSIAYAAFIPDFHFDQEDALFKGGLFLDGRAIDLVEQAKQPFLNTIEMQTSITELIVKVESKYRESMIKHYGVDVFNNDDSAFNAIADSIAEFEKTALFSPFNSKFDRVLKGEAEFSQVEALGLTVFVAEDKGNCAACHTLPTSESTPQESLFTDFSYDNLGVPKNMHVRSLNGKGMTYVDDGLFNNVLVDDVELKGAFRVSSLRNIAVTAPYMHNGVFTDLKTVIHFYNTRDVPNAINPETGLEWEVAEVDATKNTEELGDLKLAESEEQALLAFLKTLTDSQYEHLVD